MSVDTALAGGQWVTRGGVRRWVPDTPAAAPKPAPPAAPLNPTPVAELYPHGLIACPACFARMDEPCRRPTGRSRNAHRGRLVARVCPCGGSLPKLHTRICRDCEVAAHTDGGVA